MEGIGAEVSQKVKSAIKAKLVELGVYVDEELPDYIMVMVANKRTKNEMIEDLQLFLGTHTEKFISWLLQVLQKLHEVTLASLDAKKASFSSSAEKEKIVKKKKLSESESESVKKDRKKKADVSKKDPTLKKLKKGSSLKNKTVKSDVPKNVDRKTYDKVETSLREKRDDSEKTRDQASASVIKSIPLNLPSTVRSNPKPVLMVSDEDDEDFINIRADAEADLLVSELQDDIRPPQDLKQSTILTNAKSSDLGLQRHSERENTSSQENIHLAQVQEVEREAIIMSSHKDFRIRHNEDSASGRDDRLRSKDSPSALRYRKESLDTGPSCSLPIAMSVQSKVAVKSVGPTSLVAPIIKRTPGISSYEADLQHSHNSSVNQVKQDEGKISDVQRVQPTSKIITVSRIGTIKSRLGKRPSVKEDSPPITDKPKGRGVTSVVRVKGRPKVPLSAQANKNLILRAVAEAQKSVASALIRTEPILRNQGLLTRKNRNEFSKIAVTLPNPRIRSTYQPVQRTLEEETEPAQLVYQPALARSNSESFQSQAASMHNDLGPVNNIQSVHEMQSINEIPSAHDHSQISDLSPMPITSLSQPLINISPPFRSQPQVICPHNQLIQNESQIFQNQIQVNQSKAIQNQPKLNQNHPQLITTQHQQQTQSQLIQSQPQPDIVASLHEGHSTQSNMGQVGGSGTAEQMTTTDGVGNSTTGSMVRHPLNSVESDIEFQCTNQQVVRDLGHVSCSEGNCTCCVMREESTEMQEKPVSPAIDSPIETRTNSPQFFVTLSGYNSSLTNGGNGRVVRSGLGDKSRCFFMPESDDMEVEQDYLDEGIGDEDFKQEVENMDDSEMVDDLEKNTHSSGPIIFRKLASETPVNDNDITMKVKNSERCRFWPACRLGDRCEYHHPTIPCKSFRTCKFGDKCLYIHPNCKFDAACTRKDCPFTHAIPRSLVIAPVPAPVRIPVRPLSVQCRFFPKCTNVNCKFYHPKPCRFGKACNKYDCPYMHEREQLPSKEKLKWVCPGKA